MCFFTGVWADDSDNDNDVRPSFKSDKTPKSYTAPIGFVAGGVQQAGDKKKNIEVTKKGSDDDDGDDASQIYVNSSDSETDVAPARIGELKTFFIFLFTCFFLGVNLHFSRLHYNLRVKNGKDQD